MDLAKSWALKIQNLFLIFVTVSDGYSSVFDLEEMLSGDPMFLGEQRRMSSFVHEHDIVYMTSNSNNTTYKWSELLKFLR